MDMPIPIGGLFGFIAKLFGRWLNRPKLAITISFRSSGSRHLREYGMYVGRTNQGDEAFDIMHDIFNEYDVVIRNASLHPATGLAIAHPKESKSFIIKSKIDYNTVLSTGKSISTVIRFSECKRFVGRDIHEYIENRTPPLDMIPFVIEYKNLHGQRFYTEYYHTKSEREKNVHVRKQPLFLNK